MNVSTKPKQTQRLGEQTCGCQGGGGVGWTRSLGLVEANSYISKGQVMRSYCVAQGTTPSLLWQNMMEDNMRKRMYVYVWLGHFAI